MMQGGGRKASSTAPIALCVVLPHMGILDAWLPVLWELRDKHPGLNFVAFLPKPAALRGIYPGDALLSLAEVFDRVICPPRDDSKPHIFRSFQDVVQVVQYRETFSAHSAAPLDELPHAGPIDIRGFSDNVRLVCLDIKYLAGSSFARIFSVFRNAEFFSLPHGIDLRLWNSDRRPNAEENAHSQIAERCVAYLQSPHEAPYYRESYGVQEKNLRVAGIARHDPKWVERIKSVQTCHRRPLGPYIFLASRRYQNSARFRVEQKCDALRDLSRLAMELDCKLVIRRHPKEMEEMVYDEVLGIKHYGTHWTYSSLHPFVLGSEALFCVTFRSSIAVDMAALGTPTIEFFDFEGSVGDEDTPSDRRLFVTPEGQITSFYQRFGLVLGARNYAELRACAEEILSDREAVRQRQAKAYRELYTILPNPIGYVANDMERVALLMGETETRLMLR